MRAVQVAFAVILLVGLSSSFAADAQAPIEKPCNIVNCLVDPCSVTTCKPSNPAWQCNANYCGGCKTDWIYNTTGLKITTCPPDVCTAIFAPVCGVDGKTYSSACVALLNGVTVKYTGQCKCPTTSARVCGADGKTYRNKCLALQNGTTVAYAGSCLFPTKCATANLKYKPVCDGATGLIWTNACVAKVNNIKGYTPGPCIGVGPCAMCILNSGCNAPHRCKGNKKYTCDLSACKTTHILDNGKRVTYGLCMPIYKNKVTGYPAAACYP